MIKKFSSILILLILNYKNNKLINYYIIITNFHATYSDIYFEWLPFPSRLRLELLICNYASYFLQLIIYHKHKKLDQIVMTFLMKIFIQQKF